MNAATPVLAQLERTLKARLGADPANSYVASLYAGGVDAIAKKVGEEATELLLAAKNDDDPAFVHEMADLWFHTLVLLVHRGLSLERLESELARRMHRSGHEEKAARGGGK